MEKSIINALKVAYDGAYLFDFEKNSCQVYFSTFLPEKIHGGEISIKRFKEQCTELLEEGHRKKLDEFLDPAKLRSAFINEKSYDIFYSSRVSGDSYHLYKAIMLPQAAGQGLVCTVPINNNDPMVGMKLLNLVDVPAGIVRIKDDPSYTIEYANDWFYQTIGYTRKEMKEQFNNAGIRIAMDDFKLLRRIGEQGHLMGSSLFRFRHKSGRTVWMNNISSYNEDNTYTIVLVNVTQQVKKDQEAKAQDQMYRVILEKLDLRYFVYDVKTDVATLVTHKEDGKVERKQLKDYLQTLNQSAYIHPADQRKLGVAFGRIMRRGGKEVVECRSALANGKGYRWIRSSMTGIEDEDGKIYRIIGRMDNIEQEMHHREEEGRWKELAEKDSLTGLLARETGIRLMREIVETRESVGGALFLLDVDDFKEINDTKGHLFGDKVLAEIAKAFSGQFRGEDVVCRYGGDEMMAFAMNMVDMKAIKSKSDNILKAIRCIDADWEKTLTCSLGISIKPTGGTMAYETLFRNADMALYSAKNKEKNCSYIFKT